MNDPSREIPQLVKGVIHLAIDEKLREMYGTEYIYFDCRGECGEDSFREFIISGAFKLNIGMYSSMLSLEIDDSVAMLHEDGSLILAESHKRAPIISDENRVTHCICVKFKVRGELIPEFFAVNSQGSTFFISHACQGLRDYCWLPIVKVRDEEFSLMKWSLQIHYIGAYLSDFPPANEISFVSSGESIKHNCLRSNHTPTEYSVKLLDFLRSQCFVAIGPFLQYSGRFASYFCAELRQMSLINIFEREIDRIIETLSHFLGTDLPDKNFNIILCPNLSATIINNVAGGVIIPDKCFMSIVDNPYDMTVRIELARSIAYQWFGVCVRPQRKDFDTWIVKGLCEYLTNKYVECAYGENELSCKIFATNKYLYRAQTMNLTCKLAPIDEETLFKKYSSQKADFRGLSMYQIKAGFVTRMLSKQVGEEMFRHSLKMIAKDSSYARAKNQCVSLNSDTFIRQLRRSSGLDKREIELFLSQWVFGQNLPSFVISYQYVRAKNILEVLLMQNGALMYKGPCLFRVHENYFHHDHVRPVKGVEHQIIEFPCQISKNLVSVSSSKESMFDAKRSSIRSVSIDPEFEFLRNICYIVNPSNMLLNIDVENGILGQLQLFQNLRQSLHIIENNDQVIRHLLKTLMNDNVFWRIKVEIILLSQRISILYGKICNVRTILRACLRIADQHPQCAFHLWKSLSSSYAKNVKDSESKIFRDEFIAFIFELYNEREHGNISMSSFITALNFCGNIYFQCLVRTRQSPEELYKFFSNFEIYAFKNCIDGIENASPQLAFRHFHTMIEGLEDEHKIDHFANVLITYSNKFSDPKSQSLCLSLAIYFCLQKSIENLNVFEMGRMCENFFREYRIPRSKSNLLQMLNLT